MSKQLNASEEDLAVRKIDNGIVIDHIPAGLGYYVLHILGIIPKISNKTITVGINFPSKKLGKKDLLKIRGDIKDIKLEKLGLLIPGATLNIVKNYKIIEKRIITVPDAFHDLIKCPEVNCITNSQPSEPISREFTTVNKNPITVRCNYCDRIFEIKLDYLEL